MQIYFFILCLNPQIRDETWKCSTCSYEHKVLFYNNIYTTAGSFLFTAHVFIISTHINKVHLHINKLFFFFFFTLFTCFLLFSSLRQKHFCVVIICHFIRIINDRRVIVGVTEIILILVLWASGDVIWCDLKVFLRLVRHLCCCRAVFLVCDGGH